MMRFHQFSLSVIASIATTNATASTAVTEEMNQSDKMAKRREIVATPPPSPPMSPLSPILPLSPTSQSHIDKIRQQIEEEALSQKSQMKSFEYADNPKLHPVPTRYSQTYSMQQLRSKLFPALTSSRMA
ncbi:hypothetical protein BDF22DRAFT_663332 [Syncephalis plumigaleata]|nr:hypothetical protein BDF22DRAFT_663332 [Syncephalis plumigaleata]